jgi:hypothetical protein
MPDEGYYARRRYPSGRRPTPRAVGARHAVPGKDTVDKIKALLQPRKFWAGIVGVAYAFFGTRSGIDEPALVAGIATVVAYILGTALEDGLRSQ